MTPRSSSIGPVALGAALVAGVLAGPAHADPGPGSRPLTFAAEVAQTGTTTLYNLTTGDLDGDGADEIVGGGFPADVDVLHRDPTTGTWSTASPFSAGGSSVPDVVVADLDGAGRPDVAAVSGGADAVTVWTGGPAAPQTVGVSGSGPLAIAAADVDGDGRTDLVTADVGSSDVSVLTKDRVGSGYTPRRVPTGNTPVDVVARDLNGDGRTDIATADIGGRTISILTQTVDGDFEHSVLELPNGGAVARLAAADLDGDGTVELVAPDSSGSAVFTFRRSVDGSYAASNIGSAGESAFNVAVGDLDEDGTPEVVVQASDSAAGITIFRRRSEDGGYTAEGVAALPQQPDRATLALGDVDGDGRLDIVTSSYNLPGNPIDVLRNTTDVTNPTVVLTRPTDGATYALGERVLADYSCADEADGSGLASCVGTVPSGQPVDTATPGTKTFTVTATDESGNTTERTATYTVAAPAQTQTPAGAGAGGAGTGGSPVPPPATATPLVGRVTVGRPGAVRRGRGFTVPVTVNGAGRVEAIVTAPMPWRGVSAAPRVLTPSPGRFTYARAATRATTGAGTTTLRLVATRAAGRARYRSRTATVRLVVRFTPTGGKPVEVSRLVRVPVRR